MVRLGALAVGFSLVFSQVAGERMIEKRQVPGTDIGRPTASVTVAPTTTGAGSTTNPGTRTFATGTTQPTGNSGSGNNTAAASQTIDVDPRAPAGGVALITPAAISGSQYYKIGDWVTFVWNYTSLSITPTAIDILATGSMNALTYTIASNQTYEPTVTVLWDTSQFTDPAAPLLTQDYSLLVFDADKSPSAVASPGLLSTFNTFRFGMYLKQQYVPLNEFKCVTCSAGVQLADMQTVKLTLLTGMLVSLSSILFF